MPLFVRQHNALVANDAGLCVVHYALLIHSAYLRDEVFGGRAQRLSGSPKNIWTGLWCGILG